MDEEGKLIEAQITALRQRLTEARARIPAHTTPPGLMAEIDGLESELERLRHAAARDEIAAVEQRLQEARARVPKHDIPRALMAEIDELEETLARLRAKQAG